jgi:hypothetical protein
MSTTRCRKIRSTLDMAASGFAKMRQILSSDERDTDRFHFEVDRRRTVIGCGY